VINEKGFPENAPMKPPRELLYAFGGTPLDFIFHKSPNRRHLEIDNEVVEKYF
jgi:hypothetical protein